MLIEHVTMEGETHVCVHEIVPEGYNPLIEAHWFWLWMSGWPSD